jgi:hypothetical protein
MSNTGRFSVTLLVTHPTLSAEQVTASLMLRPVHARSVGARRIVGGKDLGGVHPRTFVNLAVSDGVLDNDEIEITDCIEKAMETIPLDALDQIIASGGECAFSVGIYSSKDIMSCFWPGLLSQLADHDIGLDLDFYADPTK